MAVFVAFLMFRVSSPQRQSQVALGGAGMRRELMGPEELYTSEDQVGTYMHQVLAHGDL